MRRLLRNILEHLALTIGISISPDTAALLCYVAAAVLEEHEHELAQHVTKWVQEHMQKQDRRN